MGRRGDRLIRIGLLVRCECGCRVPFGLILADSGLGIEGRVLELDWAVGEEVDGVEWIIAEA